MYLESVDQATFEQFHIPVNGNGSGNGQISRVFDTWLSWEPTHLSHHGTACCETAREWIMATDFSSLNGGKLSSGPRWLREKFKWGACSHPIHWCKAVEKKTLDCGALAALAYESFKMRGVKAFRAQFVQRFSAVAANQWSSSWSNGDPLPWTCDDLIYHEGCAIVVRNDEIKIWDSSAGWWVPTKISDGYGSLRAIRISGPGATDRFTWGDHKIEPEKWMELTAD